MVKTKFNGKVMNGRSIAASIFSTIVIQIGLLSAMFFTLRGVYVNNEYLAIILTLVAFDYIKNVGITLEY